MSVGLLRPAGPVKLTELDTSTYKTWLTLFAFVGGISLFWAIINIVFKVRIIHTLQLYPIPFRFYFLASSGLIVAIIILGVVSILDFIMLFFILILTMIDVLFFCSQRNRHWGLPRPKRTRMCCCRGCPSLSAPLDCRRAGAIG